jgi:hypothetical protein
MVDFRLRKKPRSRSGARRRPNFRLTLARGRDHFLACRAGAATARRSGPVDLESARRPDEQRGAEQQDEVYLLSLRAERMGETGIFLFRFDTVEGDTRVPHNASVMSSTRRTDTRARYISISASSTELSRRR